MKNIILVLSMFVLVSCSLSTFKVINKTDNPIDCAYGVLYPEKSIYMSLEEVSKLQEKHKVVFDNGIYEIKKKYGKVSMKIIPIEE